MVGADEAPAELAEVIVSVGIRAELLARDDRCGRDEVKGLALCGGDDRLQHVAGDNLGGPTVPGSAVADGGPEMLWLESTTVKVLAMVEDYCSTLTQERSEKGASGYEHRSAESDVVFEVYEPQTAFLTRNSYPVLEIPTGLCCNTSEYCASGIEAPG